jgi:hypothetical protein
MTILARRGPKTREEFDEAEEFFHQAVTAQAKLGVERPLLAFVMHAFEILVLPVTRLSLAEAGSRYRQQ